MVEERAKASWGLSPIYHIASHGSVGGSREHRFEQRGRGAKLGEGKDNREWNCEVSKDGGSTVDAWRGCLKYG
jgi:hypothetical protein